jgi:uncharacterized protein (UPF0332 family)
MENQESVAFGKKAKENFQASKELLSKKLFNAASNRFYYCLIHIALSTAYRTGSSKDNFTRTYIQKGKPKTYIAKSVIEKNIWGLNIKDPVRFRKLIHTMRACRDKADYLHLNVPEEELEGVIDKLEIILKAEGIFE